MIINQICIKNRILYSQLICKTFFCFTAFGQSKKYEFKCENGCQSQMSVCLCIVRVIMITLTVYGKRGNFMCFQRMQTPKTKCTFKLFFFYYYFRMEWNDDSCINNASMNAMTSISRALCMTVIFILPFKSAVVKTTTNRETNYRIEHYNLPQTTFNTISFASLIKRLAEITIKKK